MLVPNRVERLLQLNAAGTFAKTPPREFVLDRKTQQVNICQDSQETLAKCRKINRISKVVGLVALLAKALGKAPKAISSPTGLVTTLGICYLSSWLSKKLEREYYFKYTEDYRKKDLSKIPEKIWIDKD